MFCRSWRRSLAREKSSSFSHVSGFVVSKDDPHQALMERQTMNQQATRAESSQDGVSCASCMASSERFPLSYTLDLFGHGAFLLTTVSTGPQRRQPSEGRAAVLRGPGSLYIARKPD
eukprot:4388300-Amphidinium_carterae.2